MVLLFSEHGNNVALETTLTVKSKGLVLCSLYSHNTLTILFSPKSTNEFMVLKGQRNVTKTLRERRVEWVYMWHPSRLEGILLVN